MNRSNDSMDGVVHSNMKVTQREDGKFEASFPQHPNLPSAVGNSESDAVNRARAIVQDAHQKGLLGN